MRTAKCPSVLFLLGILLLSSSTCTSTSHSGDRERELGLRKNAMDIEKAATEPEKTESDSISALIEGLKEEEFYAVLSVNIELTRLGPKAVPSLIKIVKDKSRGSTLRKNAVWVLGSIGRNPGLRYIRSGISDRAELLQTMTTETVALSEPVVAVLVEALGDEDRSVRTVAAYALGQMNIVVEALEGKVEEATLLLTENLKDEESLARIGAAFALLKLTRRGKEAVPVLIEALKDKDEKVCDSARRAIADAGVDSEDASVALAKLLGHKDPDIRENAAYTLSNLYENAGAPDSGYCQRGARNVEEPLPPSVIEAFIKALKTEQDRTLLCVVCALESIGMRADKAGPALVEVLEYYSPSIHHSAVMALRKLGAQSGPALERALDSKNVFVRSGAASAYWKVSAKTEKAKHSRIVARCAAILIDTLKAEESRIRSFAADSLGDMDQSDRLSSDSAGPIVRALMEALKDRNQWVRASAAQALGKIGRNPKRKQELNALIVSSLVYALKDREYYAQDAVIKALEELSPRSIPNLIVALKDKDAFTRSGAAETLGEIGPQAKPAIPALKVALKDQASSVRKIAQKALKKIQSKY